MLNKKGFAEFRQETEKALQELAKKFGVNIHAGSISYTDNNFTLKLEVTKKEIEGKSFEQVEFEKNCWMCGLKPEDYKKQFTLNGKVYSIVAIKPRATKMPIVATRPDGSRYKFSEDTVKRLLVG
jgi:hypothetical protein